MKKMTVIIALAAFSVASSVMAYMPPPAQTHWDGYGADPFTPGPTQSNQLNQTAGQPPNIYQQQQYDANFNNNEFQTSAPAYNAPENQQQFKLNTNTSQPY